MPIAQVRFGLEFHEIIRRLNQQGFVHKRTTGSHYQMEGPNGHVVSVPKHSGSRGDITGPLLSKIRRAVNRAGGNGGALRFGGLNRWA